MIVQPTRILIDRHLYHHKILPKPKCQSQFPQRRSPSNNLRRDVPALPIMISVAESSVARMNQVLKNEKKPQKNEC